MILERSGEIVSCWCEAETGRCRPVLYDGPSCQDRLGILWVMSQSIAQIVLLRSTMSNQNRSTAMSKTRAKALKFSPILQQSNCGRHDKQGMCRAPQVEDAQRGQQLSVLGGKF